MKPELSIIVPVYNTARYLSQCIASITEQAFKNWELILVDDGSEDGSSELCDEWCQKDARIKVIHKQNTGQADSRNQALKICQGAYVGFVDSDDWIDENMYEILLHNIKSTNSDIAICNHYEETKNASYTDVSTFKTQVIKHKETHELIIKDKIKSYIWQMVFKHELLQEFMPVNKNYEDYSILPHWFHNIKQVVYTTQPLYHYRLRKSSIVHNLSLKRYYEFFQAEISRYHYYTHSPFKKMAKRMVAKRGIKAAKYISKNNSLHTNKEIKKYVTKITKDLKNIQKNGIENLSYKERFLLFLLLQHPNKFIAYQQLMHKILLHKHRNIELYE